MARAVPRAPPPLTLYVCCLFLLSLMDQLAIGTNAERIPSGMGPFRIELRSTAICPASEKCYRPEKVDITNVRVIKDQQNPYKYTYNADLNTTVPLENSYKTEIRVSKWNTLMNGWTNNVFRMTLSNPCAVFKERRPDIFKQVSDALYGGAVTDCPLPAVSRQMRDFTVETKPPGNIKSLPYGRFRARTKVFDAGQECVFCNEVIVDILPKSH